MKRNYHLFILSSSFFEDEKSMQKDINLSSINWLVNKSDSTDIESYDTFLVLLILPSARRKYGYVHSHNIFRISQILSTEKKKTIRAHDTIVLSQSILLLADVPSWKRISTPISSPE